MKVLRSTLFAAATVAFVTACGDKVNVVQPVTPHNVRTVTVAPGTATMVLTQPPAPAATLQLTAAVAADSGVATTVTWASNDNTKATVNATGLVTAVAATPGVAVCATSTVQPVSGCASIVIQSAPIQVPAQVSIASITFGNLNTPVPVPPAFTGGQIDVKLNVNANSVAIDSVIVTVDGVTAAKQSFSAAQAAAMLSFENTIAAEQVTPVTIVLSVNTALFDPVTGVTKWKNGLRNIGAKSFGKFAGTSTASSTTAAQVVQLLFGNVSGFIGGMTFTPSATQTASATDGAGYTWKSGAISVTALPVIYGAETVTNATLTFNNLGCTTAIFVGPAQPVQKVLTLTAPVPPSAKWTGTFTSSLPTGALFGTATDVGDYEFDVNQIPFGAAACAVSFAAGGEIPNIVAVGSGGTNLVLFGPGIAGGAGFLNAATSTLVPDPNFIVRLDNVAPAAVVRTMTPNGRTNNWLNDAVVLNGKNTVTTPNGMITAATFVTCGGPPGAGIGVALADCGSGRLAGGTAYTARAGLSTDANASIDASAAITSTAGLAESAGLFYRIRHRATDLLGNFVSVGTAAANSFGVDRTAPTLAIVGGPLTNARNVIAAGPYLFAAFDPPPTPPATASAFFNLALTPLTTKQQRRTAAGSTFFCPTSVTYISSVAACAGWFFGTNNYLSNLSTSDVNGSVVDAYYTITSTVADQAGNVSNVTVGVELTDATPPSIGGLSYSPFFTGGGPSTFQSTTLDNLDIQSERLALQYGAIQPAAPGAFAGTMFDANTGAAFAPTSALGGSSFWYPDQAVNGYNLTPLVTTHAMAFAVANTLTQIQVAGGAGGINPAAVNASGVMNTANGFAVDQANNATPSATPIVPGSLPAPAAITATGGMGWGPSNFYICTTSTTVAACPAPILFALAPATVLVSRDGGVNPPAVNITATAMGLTAALAPFPQFANPFSVVQFWAYNPTAGPLLEGWRLIGTALGATVTDGGAAVPNGRNWQFTVNWAPNKVTAPSLAIYKVVAIGVSSVVGGVGAACNPAGPCPGSVGNALASNIGAISITVTP